MWNFGSLISALSTEILSLSDGAGAFCSGTLNISRICLMFVKKKMSLLQLHDQTPLA
jgi:hypothetical protein